MAGRRAVQTVPKLISLIRESPTTALLKPDRSQALPSLRRSFSGYHRINPFRFEEVTESGFTVNGIYYDGSLICVGNSITSWAPTKVSEITPESLSMFQTIRPTPEEFILGCGRYETPLSPELRRYIRDIGMKLVVMGSHIFFVGYTLPVRTTIFTDPPVTPERMGLRDGVRVPFLRQ